jgi:hypothetical protein
MDIIKWKPEHRESLAVGRYNLRDLRLFGEKVFEEHLSQEANQETFLIYCFERELFARNLPSTQLGWEKAAISVYPSPHALKVQELSLNKIIGTFFKLLADNWKVETKYLSVMQQVVKHPAYQKIMEMGSMAVPLILREIQNGETDYNWDYALRKITGENPVKKGRYNYEEINKDWLEWGKRKSILDTTFLYERYFHR